jgi:hypothetical protein
MRALRLAVELVRCVDLYVGGKVSVNTSCSDLDYVYMNLHVQVMRLVR